MRISTLGLCTAAVLFLNLSLKAQDFSQYEKLKDPQISQKPHQKMLVVEAKGDPNAVAKAAFTELFSIFFKLPGAKMAAPRARWLADLAGPKENWVGFYALPLPEPVTSLPAGTEGAKIEEWEYGEVAEILHIGSYSDETSTIERLQSFITAQGYVIAGPHEEEYLKGPGMVSDPSQYWTIIRYKVVKKAIRHSLDDLAGPPFFNSKSDICILDSTPPCVFGEVSASLGNFSGYLGHGKRQFPCCSPAGPGTRFPYDPS